MKAKWSCGVVALVITVALVSCSEDDSGTRPAAPAYKDLTLRDNVLFNLQKSYNERNIDRYNELLDADFVFFVSPYGPGEWYSNDPLWDRAVEINVTRNMFDPNFFKPGVEPVSEIDLALTYPKGESAWAEIAPPDPVKYAGETWYQKTVAYAITVKAGTSEYEGANLHASFIVRWATDDGKSYWRIVAWGDDVGSTMSGFLEPGARNPLGEVTTWGKIKTVFYG